MKYGNIKFLRVTNMSISEDESPRLTVIQTDIFDVFEPLESFPPRTTTVNLKTSSMEHLESGILLRDAVNTALNHLSLENETDNRARKYVQFSEPKVLVPPVVKSRCCEKGFPIPVMFPLGWTKQNITVLGDRKKRGAGVNHLNLIQIMGRTAHSWQPYFLQDPYVFSTIVRPSLNSVEINKVMLEYTENAKR